MEMEKEHKHQVYRRKLSGSGEYSDEENSIDSSEQKKPSTPLLEKILGAENHNTLSAVFETFLGEDEYTREAAASFLAKKVLERGYSFKNQTPGFFSPFNSKKDFGITAASPIALPIAFAFCTAGATLIAAGAALTSLGSLVFAAGFRLDGFRSEDSLDKSSKALRVAAEAGIIAFLATSAAVAMTILTAVIAPLALAYLVTRSGASIHAKVNEGLSCCASHPDEERRVLSV
ncbi:Uncharacterised protein [Legionella wadsworthii]|uniref:Uncharacterized protein n=1 Tax=Legionella wadsworthii TaxID=28088 RepID=A0A378LV50_9GAMM|nr:hypothetical protein [Legionella wadsworthii]STY31751.1 Uncharacterised protein [Legionella wadsworthii]